MNATIPTLDYAPRNLPRRSRPRRRVPVEVLAGIVVGCTTMIYNAGLARSTHEELWDEPAGRNWIAFVVVAEALVSCAAGAILLAGVLALTLRSPRALSLHRTYALCKLLLLPVALAMYGLWISDPGWRVAEVRLTMLSCISVGAVYPMIVLLRLWLARRASKALE